ncbi:thioesterase superfamily enzyme [Frankia sp. EI5c]|uniref:PaaI family thioesterase n=1 Tax=Frankia sp. EI5c TaxID=683316 RepID=UPI0007C3D3B1|nr:PaaI family thioesterase [Frankia sp. EI5c]OAA25817.1 thioesterase superfamily enzyme [Frankia sp. EI5c]
MTETSAPSAPSAPGAPGGPDFGRFVENLRQLLDVVADTRPPAAVVAQVADQFAQISAQLAKFAVPEAERVTGMRLDLDGRGQTMVPAVRWDERGSERAVARVTFGRHYLTLGGAVHGGAIPLVFDEVLAMLANHERPFARSVYMNVSFRGLTRVEVPLRVEATVDRVEGRKLFLTGRLFDGDTLCAEVESLFVQLRPAGA